MPKGSNHAYDRENVGLLKQLERVKLRRWWAKGRSKEDAIDVWMAKNLRGKDPMIHVVEVLKIDDRRRELVPLLAALLAVLLAVLLAASKAPEHTNSSNCDLYFQWF